MRKKIIRRDLKTVSESLNSFPPLLQRIYQVRGIQSSSELKRDLQQLTSFESLLGMDKAVSILETALREEKTILIVGDFDADGATSTALALRALKEFGAKHLHYLVPNRFEFGYGLTPELVEVAKTFHPHVIVTVDNGIANHAGVSAAKAEGIQVVITDHHLPSETLPLADAIVNPNQPNDPFPCKQLAGVGVIFYVMLALRRALQLSGWFANRPEPVMSRLLDLVALGTVADVVPLDHTNRILVHQGLNRIRHQQCIPGITALLTVAGRQSSRITASDLGFVVGPRLNAAGRLDDMSLGIECLLTDDLGQAEQMAHVLNELNDERRVIEKDMQHQAFSFLKKWMKEDLTNLPKGLALFDSTWHQGVIGILASRLKDRYHRPVIAFAAANENELKGSARSIQGVHVRDALATLAAKYPHLILKFGGHAMAAGLTVPYHAFEDFSKAFDEVISLQLKEEDLQPIIWSDGALEGSELTLETAELLKDAGPWGQGFSEPLFDGVFDLIEQRLLGGKHLKMVLGMGEKTIDAIAFNVDLDQWPNHRASQVNIAYRLDANEFRGRSQVQLRVEHLEAV